MESKIELGRPDTLELVNHNGCIEFVWMEKSLTDTSGEIETARIYGEAGVVRDPRTEVASSYVKDVWKGNLDKFLGGWRLQRGFGN